jgi:hypothetical protein
MDSNTQQLDAAMDYILQMDFTCIAERMVRAEGWLPYKAQRAIMQYKNFLFLHKKYPQQILVPSVDIDDVWHNHILFSKRYVADCNKLFGSYLHHNPDSERASQAMQQRYDYTQELYRSEFGDYIYAVRGHIVVEQLQRVCYLMLLKPLRTVFKRMLKCSKNYNHRMGIKESV